MKNFQVTALLGEAREATDACWLRWLKEAGWERELSEAASYALLSAGKALRPALLRWSAQSLGASMDHISTRHTVDSFGLAVEMIHTYSLIHDDLPCMDNDDLRRGKPTVHKVYGEATALLVGDALLTGAFEVLAWSGLAGEVLTNAVARLSRAAGGAGMVAGQQLDLRATGVLVSREALATIHRGKTGALMGAATALGALAAMAPSQQVQRMNDLGVHMGLLFQVQDDVLDATGTAASLGKSSGKDEAQNKSTFVQQLGLEGARAYQSSEWKRLSELHSTEPYGENLKEWAQWMERRSF